MQIEIYACKIVKLQIPEVPNKRQKMFVELGPYAN